MYKVYSSYKYIINLATQHMSNQYKYEVEGIFYIVSF